MKITAVIVEDLSVAAEVLERYCTKSGRVQVKSACAWHLHIQEDQVHDLLR